jgi:hypothetical protein
MISVESARAQMTVRMQPRREKSLAISIDFMATSLPPCCLQG